MGLFSPSWFPSRGAIAFGGRVRDWADRPQDSRVLAGFRVAVASVMLLDLADRLRDAFTFYTDLGTVSRADVLWVTGRLRPGALFQLTGSPAGVVALLSFGFVVAIALLVGHRTRLANLLCWIFMLSIQDRNLAITDGGDTVLRMWLFWGLWCDLGAGHSVDARRGVRSPGRGLGLRFVRAQLAIIYLMSALSKTGLSWRHGTAIYYALASTGFTRPSGIWLLSRPTLTAALTFLTLAIEATLPALILSPVRRGACRAAALALGISLHLGIATAMRVGIFPFVMLAGFTTLVQPAWLDRWTPALVPVTPPEPEARRPSRLGRGAVAVGRIALFIAPLLVLIAIVTEQAARLAHRPSPRLVSRTLNLVEAHQNWSMFAPEPSHTLGRFEAPGLLTDGRTVDLADSAAPGLRPHFGWGYSRWEKLGLTLRDPGNPYLVPFGRFLCRRYNGDTSGPRLASFKLVLLLSPTPEPGAKAEAPSAPQRITYLEQSCGAGPDLTASRGTADSSR
ncbi:MAG TPA: HTTM domain-containing protein [Polyangia bacterium]|jgi:hypothetical protein|nr:HTTM domain-containing protein [Polyangia bacterium]